MLVRALVLWVVSALSVAGAATIALPPRPPDAVGGSAFADRIADLDLAAREALVLAEVRHGNVPDFWRHFAEVKIDGGAFFVSPDYLAIGGDDDYLLMPVSPTTAQAIADEIDCVLPTRHMVDAIYRAAPLKLEPSPIPPSAAMTTVAVFAQYNATVHTQRTAALAAHPLGTLVAGHKKDVVLTPQLAASPGKVAIYGWHKPDGSAIQPLYLGHTANWVDYSHGARFVARAMAVHGAATSVDAVLADPTLCTLLSDEGPIRDYRYGAVRPLVIPYPGEKSDEFSFGPDVRVAVNSPSVIDASKPTQLVLYALPAGNTIEQTIGHRLHAGEDWHVDIQHLGAQTRWLRAHDPASNLLVAYLESADKSWVLWRRKHLAEPQRIREIVDALRQRYSPATITLASHSAGGALVFGYFDSVDQIPADIGRIAFLDSDYAYDATKGHAAKLVQWLSASDRHRLCVFAYQDYLALLDGKTFVSEAGGTWGRSQAMLHDLAATLTFTRTDAAGLQTHAALEGRAKFFLKENPEKVILHTRQVEWNGFIHALLTGTAREGQGYDYLGARAYPAFIAEW